MSEYNRENIRNFSIIAHIDHGKSTIADRLLELTETVSRRDMQAQVLDAMDLEREKGITIKAHPVRMYLQRHNQLYEFNLIDTPGHVDFTYEVSRSLAACEGALLIVDAVQGVQAQSLANVYLALERGLEIIPIINKIDLPSADVAEVRRQIEEFIGIDTRHLVAASAKQGIGIEDIIEAIIRFVPAPKAPDDELLRALVFDSHYDSYKGVMVYVRVFSGEIRRGMQVEFLSNGLVFEVLEVGIFRPSITQVDCLLPGQVGYFAANIKNSGDIKTGDTVTGAKKRASVPLPGFREVRPVVFAGIYPVDSDEFEDLREALAKLRLNDSALHVEQESSTALGFGFRCGFLGLLHLEIVFERLQREFDLDIITTSPSVVYRIFLKDGSALDVDNPAYYPDPSTIDHIEEPWVRARLFIPADYLGVVMNLAMEKRGECTKTETLDARRLVLTYGFPMGEVITDFNDRLKSITSGYGSFDYELDSYREGDIIKLEIRVNEEPVDAFSLLIHRTKAESKGRWLCGRLLELIPKQLFRVPIQAAIGGKIIARETISALAKNVTAKCYGGDITRKRKLWEKQKKGKARMKQIGKVQIPQSTFMDILKDTE